MRRVAKPQDFEKFYFRYVANGEGCGCAERVIDNHEIERLAEARRVKGVRPRLFRRLRDWLTS